MSEHEHGETHQHLLPYSLYFKVWAVLIALTAVTVGVAHIEMYKYTVFTAMFVATVKVSLVLLYFMHLRFEKRMLWYMILAALITYGIFVALTFSDYFYR